MKEVIVMVLTMITLAVIVSTADALIIEKPVEGQIIVVGEPFEWVVSPAPGEACKWISGGEHLLNPATGKFEYTDIIEPKDHSGQRLGRINYWVLGKGVDDDSECLDAHVTLNVVLPPSTTVVSIGAAFSGTGEEAFLNIARKQNGEFIVTEGTTSTNRISVGATYSDGVEREITENPDVTYESLDEKVAIMLPHALVKATGPGETKIIVRYQGHESNVTVHVRECPYIEGKTEKEGCP